MSYRDILRAQLRIDEGVRGQPYDDATGKAIRAPKGKVTIGIGHNLDAKPLSAAVMALILEEDMDDAEADARALVPNFDRLTPVRQAVICNMAFNMGRDVLSGFKNTLKAVNEGRYEAAARGMRASLWARQTKGRADRLIEQMRDG